MPELRKRYREVQSTAHLTGGDNVILTIRSEFVWSAGEAANRQYQIVFEAHRGAAEPIPADRRRFSFIWPEKDAKRLADAIRLLAWHVENRNFVTGRESEVYVEIYDWLRIGWLDWEEGFFAFADLLKPDAALRLELDDLTALHEMQQMLETALEIPASAKIQKAK